MLPPMAELLVCLNGKPQTMLLNFLAICLHLTIVATHAYYHDYTVGNPSSIKVHLDISVKIQELVHTALVFNGEDVCMVSAAILDSNDRVCH